MIWAPISVDEAVAEFANAPFRWWIAGGIALELHAGYEWRKHEDFDIGICRYEAQATYGWLTRNLSVAAQGRLYRWDGHALEATHHENNVWAAHRSRHAWAFDITIGDGTDDLWIYRRDPSVTRPWAEAVLKTTAGVPYLAPDLQLLFKSTILRSKDTVDAEMAIPALSEGGRSFLRRQLATDHPWQALLA